jgi:uncharacterized protein with HEPN domain
MRGDRAYLAHIVECIRRIEEDTVGGREQFFASHTIQDAVIRNLQILAESSKRLSDDLKAAQHGIEWSSIGGLRNVLVHAYLDVDLEVVWGIVQSDLPKLKKVMSAVLQPNR